MSARSVDIYFATNRKAAPANGAWGGADFTSVVASQPGLPVDLAFGTARVDGIDPEHDVDGTIRQIGPVNLADFSDSQLAALLSSKKDILVFVHGTDNSFADAVIRGAYNRAWLYDYGQANRTPLGDYDLILFSWPARSYSQSNGILGEANIFADAFDYEGDKKQAGASAYHFCLFLQQLGVLRRRAGRRRLNLLCHSMGDYMLAGAVERLFRETRPNFVPLFDKIILAAPDEQSDSFSVPNDGRLSNLRRLGSQITLYANRNDLLMKASRVANCGERLGYLGPPNAADTRFFSTNIYDFVDCSDITDSIGKGLLDSHQYYRESPTVRTDIVQTLTEVAPTQRRYEKTSNIYTLVQRTV